MGNDLTHEVVSEGTEVDDATRVSGNLSTVEQVSRNAKRRKANARLTSEVFSRRGRSFVTKRKWPR